MLEFTTTVEGEHELDRLWSDKVLPALEAGIKSGVEVGMREGIDQASRVHAYTDRTGDLSRGGRSEMISVSMSGESVEGEMWWVTPYALFVENGTKRHPISASGLAGGGDANSGRDNGGPKALHFFWKGVECFFARVNHPGSKPYPFAGPAILKTDRVAEAQIEIAVSNAARILWEAA
jgi:hypothetical protein